MKLDLKLIHNELDTIRNTVLNLEIQLDNREISRVGASNVAFSIRASLDQVLEVIEGARKEIE
jgi:hypothetical protein